MASVRGPAEAPTFLVPIINPPFAERPALWAVAEDGQERADKGLETFDVIRRIDLRDRSARTFTRSWGRGRAGSFQAGSLHNPVEVFQPVPCPSMLKKWPLWERRANADCIGEASPVKIRNG